MTHALPAVLITVLFAGAATLALPSLASAHETCGKTITGTGRSSGVEGSADFVKYHGKVPAKLAERRAIASWRFQVEKHCAGANTWWWRAHNRSVQCEGSAGHTDCTASAIPRG